VASFLIEIGDELLTFGAERLGATTYEDTIKASLRTAAGLTDRIPVSEPASSNEDAADTSC
jgi:hypothetical protein